MKQFIRTGAYALIINEDKILLTLQKQGPSKGLWHLPGGGIEFSETPLQTLERELIEEAALKIVDPKLLTVLSFHGEYFGDDSYRFHYIGLVYRVSEYFLLKDKKPEDISCWLALDALDFAQTSAFVRQLLDQKFL